jgi:hypothetical protein
LCLRYLGKKDYFEGRDQLDKLMGREHSGSGFGCGGGDLDWYFSHKATVIKKAKLTKKLWWTGRVTITPYINGDKELKRIKF